MARESLQEAPYHQRGSPGGKTWLIKEFGRRHYKSVAYVNMDNNSAMRELFDTGYDIDVLIAGLQLQTGVTIEPDSTPHRVRPKSRKTPRRSRPSSTSMRIRVVSRS